MPKQKIAKEYILETTYQMAVENGLRSVSARSIAKRCGVSVGSIYNYYPSMDELYTDVVERFFRIMFSDESCKPIPKENFVVYCRRLYARMKTTLQEFKRDWMDEIASMSASTVAAGKKREGQYQGQMAKDMQKVLEDDPSIDRTMALSRVSDEDFSLCTYNSLVDSISHHQNAEPLFTVLAYSLYPTGSDAFNEALTTELQNE